VLIVLAFIVGASAVALALCLALFGISLAVVVLLAPSFLLAFLAKGTLRFVLGQNDPSQDKPFHSRIKLRERDED
jgi:membrane protein implicated in regulation of membrane protease activity